MKRFPLLIALLLVPAAGWAQAFPIDFDPDSPALDTPAAPQSAAPVREADAPPRPRAVRYAQRSVRMVAGTSPMAAELDLTRLPAGER